MTKKTEVNPAAPDDAAADPAGANGQEPEVETLDPAERVRELEAEVAEIREARLRTEAELQNVMKRHSREVSDRARYAAEGLARDLLDVIDDLDRALEHASGLVEGQDAQEMAGVVEGVKMVRGGLLQALERHGISRLESHGRPFDPSEHDAVALVESIEHGPNTVVDEHRAGYRIHDRLLRPAMVAVSKTPDEESEDK